MTGNGVHLTIRDAARATGLSIKAIQRRIERGSLDAQLIDGVRRIPLTSLVSAGLMVRKAPPGGIVRRTGAPEPAVAELRERLTGLEERLASVERELAERRDAPV